MLVPITILVKSESDNPLSVLEIRFNFDVFVHNEAKQKENLSKIGFSQVIKDTQSYYILINNLDDFKSSGFYDKKTILTALRNEKLKKIL